MAHRMATTQIRLCAGLGSQRLDQQQCNDEYAQPPLLAIGQPYAGLDRMSTTNQACKTSRSIAARFDNKAHVVCSIR